MAIKKSSVTKVKENYTENSIKTLEGVDAVRKRYGMYIGSGGEEGVLRLFYEILGNAIDEFQAERASSILVKLNEKTGEIQISDNGIGLFQNKIEESCTKLHSSGKFESDYSKYSIGQNGVGLTVTNALSEKLVVIVKRDGYFWSQTFKKGKKVSELERGEKLKKSDGTGTTILFKPDVSVLKDVTINTQRYEDFLKLSTYQNRGLEIQFQSNTFKGTKTFISKNGMIDLIKELDNTFLLKQPIQFSDKTEYFEEWTEGFEGWKEKLKTIKASEPTFMDVEVTLNFSKNDTDCIRTFCNGLETKEGGSHAAGFKMAISEFFVKAVKESSLITKKDSNIEILPEDVREGLTAVVNVKHSNAVFKSQTKDQLNVEEVKWFVKKVTMENITKWVKTNPTQAKTVYQRILIAAKGRMAANRAKTAKKKEAGGLINGLSSLSKVTLATGKDPKNKRFFIVEGDSASGSVVKARCTATDTIMRLRGKPLNTFELNIDKVEANKEWNDIITTLGCGADNTFDISKLTHDQIISTADADVDGFHISILLAGFFFKHMPKIISEGHFYIAKAPLYKVEENSKIRFFITDDEYTDYLVDKIIKKYSVGRVILKDGAKKLKPFTHEELFNFIKNTKSYKIDLKNISSNKALDTNIAEIIANNLELDAKEIKVKIQKLSNELSCNINKKGVLHVQGMYNNKWQIFDLDDEIKSDLSVIYESIKKYSYKNLYFKKEGQKAKRVFIGELLDEILGYAVPKHKQRFKGLGEMDYDELWVTTLNPNSKGIVQIKADSMEELKEVLTAQLQKDPSQRKEFLKTFKILPEDIDN